MGSSLKNGEGGADKAKIVIDGGDLLNISSNTFDKKSADIHTTPQAENFVVHGNLFEKSQFPAYSDHSTRARKIVANNLWYLNCKFFAFLTTFVTESLPALRNDSICD